MQGKVVAGRYVIKDILDSMEKDPARAKNKLDGYVRRYRLDLELLKIGRKAAAGRDIRMKLRRLMELRRAAGPTGCSRIFPNRLGIR